MKMQILVMFIVMTQCIFTSQSENSPKRIKKSDAERYLHSLGNDILNGKQRVQNLEYCVADLNHQQEGLQYKVDKLEQKVVRLKVVAVSGFVTYLCLSSIYNQFYSCECR